ncbi:hypothetical protein [uncultured Mucilaginibacter sp.]|uniref:hypothetical protein n=1 Tax=uncultured Mucilaginibacter sp. TaxID=797541 RepID=UPI0025EC5346|nr:hypothetical protein [uncultured Mucilaginibacter sp.]
MKLRLFTTIVLLLLFQNILAQTAKDSLYVFVGEKIEVKQFYIKPFEIDSTSQHGIRKMRINMDDGFNARYKVIQNVFNHFNKDTIEFIVFDHENLGTPPFSKFKYVLIFVSEINGKMYHQKYLYCDVYLTSDGKWASPGDPNRFGNPSSKPVKAVPIQFKEPLIFDITDLPAIRVKKLYPEPYYKIENNKAIAVMGAYVDDLFEIEKNGYLKARGIFK